VSRNVKLLLGEILDAIQLIQRYTQGVDYVSFASDTEKQDAVLRRLEIIDEAVKGLPVDILNAHPATPWREIAGARDVLIHEYFRVDIEMAWEMFSATCRCSGLRYKTSFEAWSERGRAPLLPSNGWAAEHC